MKRALLGAACAVLLCVNAAYADGSYQVKTAFGSYNVGDRINDQALIATILAGPNAGFIKLITGTPPSTTSGTVIPSGTDYSSNPLTIPLPGYVLLQTINANQYRRTYYVQNQSNDIGQIVEDDGSGNSPTSWLINPTSAVSQGAGFSSPGFLGRVRIYGKTAQSQIAGREYP